MQNPGAAKPSHLLSLCAFVLACALLIVLPAPSSSQEVDCSSLTDLDCIGSDQCVLSPSDQDMGYVCEAPRDQCQLGFRQAILSPSGMSIDTARIGETIANCTSKAGCKYQPAEKCFCPPDVNCICGGGAPPNCVPLAANELDPPAGDFRIVDIRRASDVAGPPLPEDAGDALGRDVLFTSDGLFIEGLSCDAWEIRGADVPVNMSDPNLSDVMIAPVDAPGSSGDRRILRGWNYGCEGESFLDVFEVDNQVLLAPFFNSSAYLVLERQLPGDTITAIQEALAGVKFFDGSVTGQLDDTTLAAIAEWAAYRSENPDAPRFARPAITENLFDGMGVFQRP